MNGGASGVLYLVPNSLMNAAPGVEAPALTEVLAHGVIARAAQLEHWIAESAKAARVFLKQVDAIVPLARPLQQVSIVELPRPRKGAGAGPAADLGELLRPATAGGAIGLISDAGLPAVADPGAALVEAAHRLGIQVVALPGSSSLLLALAASGLNGQCFAFVGYLPTDAAHRADRIRRLEGRSRADGETQIVIETPYRNAALLAALLENLRPETRLAVSCGLTSKSGFSCAAPVAEWRARRVALPADVPAVFSFLAG